jgi:hypothetical protein
MSCCQQPAPPQRDAAKMSPLISICPEPVLADHAPSPPAVCNHCPAREGSASNCGTEFFSVHHQRANVGRGLEPGAALIVVCLTVVTLPTSTLQHQMWLVVVWLAVVSSAD